jgi:hypothetical protein
MLILVDSGSTHSFVSTTFLQKTGLQAQAGKPQVVRVANGETLMTNAMVPQMEWWCQGHTFQSDMKVLDLEAFDAILGYDWLQQYSPMICHWNNKTLSFTLQGK